MAERRQRSVLIRERAEAGIVWTVQVVRNVRPGLVAGGVVERVQHAVVTAGVHALGTTAHGRDKGRIARIVAV